MIALVLKAGMSQRKMNWIYLKITQKTQRIKQVVLRLMVMKEFLFIFLLLVIENILMAQFQLWEVVYIYIHQRQMVHQLVVILSQDHLV